MLYGTLSHLESSGRDDQLAGKNNVSSKRGTVLRYYFVLCSSFIVNQHYRQELKAWSRRSFRKSLLFLLLIIERIVYKRLDKLTTQQLNTRHIVRID